MSGKQIGVGNSGIWCSTDNGVTKHSIWHEGNDGSGSGLDADLLGGLDSTRFYIGNFSAIDNQTNVASLGIGSYHVTANKGLTYPVPDRYSSLTCFGKAYYSSQLCVKHDASRAWLRGIYNSSNETTASDWHELAFTDAVDWYGVSWSENDSNPTCTRIGNMAMHRSLPI